MAASPHSYMETSQIFYMSLNSTITYLPQILTTTGTIRSATKYRKHKPHQEPSPKTHEIQQAPRAESYQAAIKEIAEKNALLETINQQQHELIQKNLQFQRELINTQNTTQ